MEYDDGRQRRTRPDDQYPSPQNTRVPRLQYGSGPKPPTQSSAQLRPYQNRAAPRYAFGKHPAAYVSRHPDQHKARDNHGRDREQIRPQYSEDYDSQLSPPTFQKAGRHFSHISALSSQPALDSRPVSEIESEYVPGPALDHTRSALNDGSSVKHYPATHNGGYPNHTTPGTTPPRGGSVKYNRSRRESESLPPNDNPATMAALSAAIRTGLRPNVPLPQSTIPKPSNDPLAIRMPFQGEPESPTSMYTDFTGAPKRLSVPLSSYQGYERRHSKPSTISEHEIDDYEKANLASGILTPRSHLSTTPIVAAEQPGMSARIPASKRPPKLDIGAVREAEARGSMTSLSDLIRRATKLASNLDRGRTASRLGHLDMFGSNEKLGGSRVRDSTYSDVLAAFPSPADGTGTPGKGRPTTIWPNGQKQFMTSKSSLGRIVEESPEKAKRKCCGLSPPVFVVLFVIVVLLIAAAVLLPVFLIVLPNQRRAATASNQCPSSHTCHNGGVSSFANGVCACICVDGFTGSDCSSERDPDCVTTSFRDGSKTYDNATVGSSVLPILQDSQKSFGVPLNMTAILTTFAYNNLSCVSENSLVNFNNSVSTRTKRFVMLPGMVSTNPHIPVLNLPEGESSEHKRFVIVDGLEPAAERLQVAPTKTLRPRQDATQSSNGIVFATSSATTNMQPDASAAAASGNTASVTASTTSTPTPSSTIKATDAQLNFAATVVLYVLQSFPEINVAVSANQAISSYFEATSASNSTVEVVGGSQRIEADFKSLQIIFANGTRTSGGSSSS